MLISVQLPSGLSCIDKLILTCIASVGEDEYSVSFLSKTLSISRKSAHISLNRLTLSGYLEVTEPASGRRATTYKVVPKIAQQICNK